MLTFIIILLVLVALAAVVSIGYGIFLQRLMKGKQKSGWKRIGL